MAMPGRGSSLVLSCAAGLLAACAEPDAIGAREGAIPAGDEAQLVQGGVVDEPDVDRPGGGAGPGRDPEQGPQAGLQRDPRCARGDGGIDLMHGFCAAVVADNLGKARHLAISPSGDLYVAIMDEPGGQGAPGRTGGLIALRDEDDDGVAERMERIVEGGGNGVAWHDGRLYFAQDDRILRFDAPDGRLVPSRAEPDVIVDGLPVTGDHTSKTIVVSDDGFLYVNIPSATNSCQRQNRQPGSMGQEPCAELLNRAGIWRFDADRTNQTVDDGERWATGLRNGTALAIHRTSGSLVTIQNGRDQLFDNFPQLYSEVEEAVLPAEELFLVNRGDDFGWPYCYFDGVRGMKVLAPEYGGDGDTVGRCANTEMPDAWFPAHWAPLGMTFLEGRAMPVGMRRGMLVAFHGSWHQPEANVAGPLPGYLVSYVPFDNGMPTSQIHPFAWNFAGTDRPLPENARFRPVDVKQAPDGSIYISDDQQGRIWRVFAYGG